MSSTSFTSWLMPLTFETRGNYFLETTATKSHTTVILAEEKTNVADMITRETKIVTKITGEIAVAKKVTTDTTRITRGTLKYLRWCCDASLRGHTCVRVFVSSRRFSSKWFKKILSQKHRCPGHKNETNLIRPISKWYETCKSAVGLIPLLGSTYLLQGIKCSLANALLMPHVFYGLEVAAGTTAGNFLWLSRVVKSMARFVYGLRGMEYVSDLDYYYFYTPSASWNFFIDSVRSVLTVQYFILSL
uniref:Uncharacterized protein n=1 Tax=Glossina austeni TaxID=7395 RepID=A0A1A9UES1_GLOAU